MSWNGVSSPSSKGFRRSQRSLQRDGSVSCEPELQQQRLTTLLSCSTWSQVNAKLYYVGMMQVPIPAGLDKLLC
jgi:hypothetical protein